MSEPKTADEIQARAVQLRRKFFPDVPRVRLRVTPKEKPKQVNFRVAYPEPIGPQLPLLTFKPALPRPPVDFEIPGQTIRRIISEEAARFGYTVADIMSGRREYALAFARHKSMWRSKCETTWSLPRIGRMFGGKDHTSVLHAIRRIEALQRQGQLEATEAAVILYKIRKDIELDRRFARSTALGQNL